MFQSSRLIIIFIAFCFITGCAYTEKITNQILPNSEFKKLVVEGDAAMQAADWNKAIAKFEQAVQLKPKDLDVKLKQALAYQRAGKLARAHNTYQQIIDEGVSSDDKNIKIVKIAKTNQAKFGFNNILKEPEAVLTKEQVLDEAQPVVLEEHLRTEPIEAPVKEKSHASSVPIKSSESHDDDNEALATPIAESAKVELRTIAPYQTVEVVSTLPELKFSAEEVTAEVSSAIQSWVLAWENKKIDMYLSHYLNDFKSDMPTVKAWRKDRNTKIVKAKALKIKLEDIQVKVIDADNVNVSFTQHYQSFNYQDVGSKLLKLKRIDGHWLIAHEQFVRKE